MKNVIIYYEGKNDVFFFTTLLNLSNVLFVGITGKDNVEKNIKDHNLKYPNKKIYVNYFVHQEFIISFGL